jgi:hypothetical protein
LIVTNPDKCPIIEKIYRLWDELRKKGGFLDKATENTGLKRKLGRGKGTGKFSWCYWVEIEGNGERGRHIKTNRKREVSEDKMEVSHMLAFRFDNYCSDNCFHLRDYLFDESSGNPHEIRHMGYIQFVEAKNKYGSNPETASFKENGKWVFPDNENPNTGRVAPLRFCDTPISLYKDNIPKQHIHVLDFFYDNDGNFLEKPCDEKVNYLATAFVKWIEGLQP